MYVKWYGKTPRLLCLCKQKKGLKAIYVPSPVNWSEALVMMSIQVVDVVLMRGNPTHLVCQSGISRLTCFNSTPKNQREVDDFTSIVLTLPPLLSGTLYATGGGLSSITGVKRR